MRKQTKKPREYTYENAKKPCEYTHENVKKKRENVKDIHKYTHKNVKKKSVNTPAETWNRVIFYFILGTIEAVLTVYTVFMNFTFMPEAHQRNPT